MPKKNNTKYIIAGAAIVLLVIFISPKIQSQNIATMNVTIEYNDGTIKTLKSFLSSEPLSITDTTGKTISLITYNVAVTPQYTGGVKPASWNVQTTTIYKIDSQTVIGPSPTNLNPPPPTNGISTTVTTGSISGSQLESLNPSSGSHTLSITANVIVTVGTTSQSGTTTTSVQYLVAGSALVDTIAPAISIIFPLANAKLTTAIMTVSGTSSDAGSGVNRVEVSIDGGAYSLATGTTSWSFTTAPLSQGSHTITARATDNAGNSAFRTITITIDTTAPSVSIITTRPSNGASISRSVSFFWGVDASSPVGIANVRFYIDGSAFAVLIAPTVGCCTYYKMVAAGYLSVGTHRLTAIAVDNNNVIGETEILINIIG